MNYQSFAAHAAILAVLAAFPDAGISPVSQTRITIADATTRARGNRLATALRIGLVLFRTRWPAQILRVRVDGVGTHEVAALNLSAVKFHQCLDLPAFEREVAAIVRLSFAASDVEEIDVQAEAPVRVGEHAVVSGDLAEPVKRVVYGVTVRRERGGELLRRLRTERDVYIDPAFRLVLGAKPATSPAIEPFGAGIERIPPARSASRRIVNAP